MERLTRYVKDAWNITQALYVTKKAARLNIALGNVSGDMDSVIGSIILGYYLTYKNDFYAEEEKDDLDVENLSEDRLSKFVVPIINMNNKELEARHDIICHLEKSGVVRDQIVSYDMLDMDYFVSQDNLEVNLVDHNHPDCNQEQLIPYVTNIYDHHLDKETEYPKIKYKDVRFCGAAVTLVVNAILEDADLADKLVDDKVALFFCSAILIDSVNLSEDLRGKKWDQIDEDTYKKLKSIAGETIPDDYFKELYHNKVDEKINIALGYNLLARKDYKNFKMGNGLMIGISTVFLDIKICEKEFTAEKLVDEFKDIMKERGLDLYVILTHYEDEGVKRQILSYSTDKELSDKAVELWEGIEDIKLDRIEVGALKDVEGCYVWQNHATSYSRKKFEPFIRKFYEN